MHWTRLSHPSTYYLKTPLKYLCGIVYRLNFTNEKVFFFIINLHYFPCNNVITPLPLRSWQVLYHYLQWQPFPTLLALQVLNYINCFYKRTFFLGRGQREPHNVFIAQAALQQLVSLLPLCRLTTGLCCYAQLDLKYVLNQKQALFSLANMFQKPMLSVQFAYHWA